MSSWLGAGGGWESRREGIKGMQILLTGPWPPSSSWPTSHWEHLAHGFPQQWSTGSPAAPHASPISPYPVACFLCTFPMSVERASLGRWLVSMHRKPAWIWGPQRDHKLELQQVLFGKTKGRLSVLGWHTAGWRKGVKLHSFSERRWWPPLAGELEFFQPQLVGRMEPIMQALPFWRVLWVPKPFNYWDWQFCLLIPAGILLDLSFF